jgi:hypothetical protein
MAKPATKRKLDDLFDALDENIESTPKKKASPKKGKPEINLSAEEQRAFEAFCAANVIFKMAEGKKDASKSLIVPVLRRKLLEKWLKEGHKTENPLIQTENARANFVARGILKIDLPEHDDGTPASIKERLMEVGFTEDEADEIMEREFTEKVERNFRNLNELRNGDDKQQKAVKKLIDLVLENLSPEEQRILIRKDTKVEVNDGFLDRAVQHADGDIEKLDNILNIVAPQWVLSHVQYSGTDLNKTVSDLTGGELPEIEDSSVKAEEFYSADNQWKAVVQGANASLYKCSEDEGEVLLGIKKCNGGVDHARMTCKKWLRDDAYRATAIAEFLAKK